MASITITNYNASTGQIYFTSNGFPTWYNFTLLKSTDSGATWSEIATFNMSASPAGVFLVSGSTQFKLVAYGSSDIYSNIYDVVPLTYTVTRTPIELETDISFCNSPIHIRVQNDLQDATIQTAFVYLWIWNGAQNKTLNQPNQVLYAEKVSQSDNYINFEISEYIKAFLINPDNALNTNQPQFAYNELTPPTITGQGVFWQIIADVTSTSGGVRKNYRTSFATLGYRYDFEQAENVPYSANLPTYDKFWNPKIHDYFEQYFNFGQDISTATVQNMINFGTLYPSNNLREALDPYLLVYLAKDGLFRTFTPNGRVVFENKIARTEINIGFRNPSGIDTSYTHMKLNNKIDVTQTINLNTGILEAEMVEEVRQIILSPKIYLIKFEGDLQTELTTGITIDNTYVTIDNTNITIDSETVGDEYFGKYKTHRQIPVRLTDTDFEFKTRLNDKNKIDYTLKFEVTTNLINDLR